MTTTRSISHSEVSSALDCQVRHAFQYTGQLTDGDTLKPHSTAMPLREGRAWGRAVAAWHEHHDLETAGEHARVALEIALSLDAADQQKAGVYDPDEHTALAERLTAILEDYTATAEHLPLTRLEHELYVAIPSRTGRRASTRYRLGAFLDGVHTDDQGRDWIVEFKLRKRLTSYDMIAKARQTRWYAWAWRRETGRPVAGVIVEERLNEVPPEVRLNQDRSPSKVQSCRPEAYLAAFENTLRDPDEEVLAKLEQKRWQHRTPLLLTERELDEAGHQLASAGMLIHQLDTGLLYPVRNPSPMRCPGCAFKDACTDPTDTDLIDAMYRRTTPKRNRGELAHAA